MNTMKWLIKRELWEHKSGFFWAPLVFGGVMTVLFALLAFMGVAKIGSKNMRINGQEVTGLSNVMSPETVDAVVTQMVNGYMGFSMPLLALFSFVTFYVCLGALFDERKDRSVLFWKSLPVSDTETVLSKVVVAIGVAPLIALAVATIVSLCMLLLTAIAAAAGGVNVFGKILGSSALYVAPFQVAAVLPVYILWALPSVGWLLMVSAWARAKPLLWAVVAPLLTAGLISWFNSMFEFGLRTDWMWNDIIGRGLLSIVPGSWIALNPLDGQHIAGLKEAGLGPLLSQSWQQLGAANLWIGVVAGCAMIYAAIRLRRWRDEG